MANPRGNPQNLRPAKKGEVRNPLGRPKSVFTGWDSERIHQTMLTKTRIELEEIIKNPKSIAAEIAIAQTLLTSMAAGDPSKLEYVLSRAIGKVAEKIEQDIKTTNMNLHLMSDEQLLAISREAIKVIENNDGLTLPETSQGE
jgi:hypothetical protein